MLYVAIVRSNHEQGSGGYCAWSPPGRTERPDIRMLLDLPVICYRLIASPQAGSGLTADGSGQSSGKLLNPVSFSRFRSICVSHTGPKRNRRTKSKKRGSKKHVLSSSLPNFRLAMSSLLLFCFCFSPPVLSAFRRLHRSDSVVLLSHAGLASHIWKTYSSRAPFSFALPRRVPPRGLPICARSRGAAREPLSVRLSACSASSVLVENSDYD